MSQIRTKIFNTAICSIITFFATFIFISCNDEEPKPQNISNRTILVYMVASNSLGIGHYDTADIAEMIAASNSNNFNNGRLIIYHAPYGKNPSLKEVTNGQVVTLREYSQSTSSVEQKRMQEVIDDTKKIAPAHDYGLILWSHANGWLQNGIVENKALSHFDDTQKNNIFSFGDDKGKYMNITTLANVLNDENFSFIYFDCCFMASIEVIYELRKATPYIIASAPEIPADGMPYEQNIPLLFANNAKLKEVCATTFDYYNNQKGINNSCAISLIDTRHIDSLANATVTIYEQHTPLPNDFTPQKYSLEFNCYYFDFGQYVKALASNIDEFKKWQEALNKVVIYKASTQYMWNKLKLEHHSGLSTYILHNSGDSIIKNYNQLSWWSDVASKYWE